MGGTGSEPISELWLAGFDINRFRVLALTPFHRTPFHPLKEYTWNSFFRLPAFLARF